MPEHLVSPTGESEKDKGYAKRVLGKNPILSLVALLYSLFIIYTSLFGFFTNIVQRSMYVGFALVLAFFMYPNALKKNKDKGMNLLAWICVFFSVVTTGWVALNYDRFMMEATSSTILDLVFAVILVLLLLESARRSMGSIFVILTFITIGYAFAGPWLPDDFAHRGFSLEYIAQHLYIGSYGIWGTTTGTMVSMVSIFIIFGSVLSVTGGARVFLNIAAVLGGRSTGGPAKVAVIGSSLFGMISGSASANGAVIGAMTIPMMKKRGYSSEFAAATEAVAGTGGQIMPPIMGAGAFIIAEKLSVPYIDVAIAAAIPAIVYYIGLFSAVHFVSLKFGMKGLSGEDAPDYKKELTLKRLIQLCAPLVVLVSFLTRGYTVATSGVLSIILAMLFYMASDLRPDGWSSRIKELLGGLIDAGKGLVLIALLGACADIIVGMLSLTGLGVELSSAIYSLSKGFLIVGLLLGMVTTLILGMGLPTTAAYILGSSVVAPALANFNVEPMAANLFLFYFACISAFTPPVCVAIYITSGIAQSNWVKSGLVACRLGAAGFLVPYLAVYNPALLTRGSIETIALQFVIAFVGTVMLAGGLMGNFYYNIGVFAQVVLIVGGLLTLYPGYLSSFIGVIMGIGVFFAARRVHKVKVSFS
ncbi:MAG: TRAP transporter fused permease subunit [Synergistaceae bacterium]|jgi:TRAP transporter 4TM/12TM fusion protein|nr:TRAP transporter fused permease subunit [Synergistaceae bacterium]